MGTTSRLRRIPVRSDTGLRRARAFPVPGPRIGHSFHETLAATSGRVSVHADLSAAFAAPSGDGQDDLGAAVLLLARVLVDGCRRT